jgi:hypothetical protein
MTQIMKNRFLKYQGQNAMRKSFFLAALAMLFFVGGSVQAQIYVEFESPVKKGNRPYTPLQTGATVYTANNFTVPPNIDPDDGFAAAQLPFPFEYNGTVYNWILINVNGFVMMNPDGNVPLGVVGQNVPARLFDGSQFPRNVIAPYWGDHFFRIGGSAQPGYMPSQVLTGIVTIGGRRAFCIEWRNLNINDKTLPSSVGNFQMYMYEQTVVPGNSQGDIEFAYGQVGGNPNTPLTTVITRNAAIGMKGSAPQGDWLNAFFTAPQNAFTSTTLSNQWQPSGGSDTVFVFKAIPRLRLNVWGDGDADFSSAPGSRHYSKAQNQYVTAGDALSILRSVATNIPLDSLVKRMAFKGDVDHNGRFYYSTRNFSNTADTARYRREWRARTPLPRNNWTLDEHFMMGSPATQDSLLRLHTYGMPSDNSLDFQSIYFQVNAYDAALIMHYLGGRVITLPWTLDTVVPFGKAGNSLDIATGVAPLQGYVQANGTTRIPVYLNGANNGAVSVVFNANSEVVNVETIGENMINMFNGNRVVIAGSIKNDGTEPIAFVTVRSSDCQLVAGDVEFNGEAQGNVTIDVAGETGASMLTVSGSNPTSSTSNVTVQIPNAGEYALRVFDVTGNTVATLATGSFAKGTYSYTWDGRSTTGAVVSNGVYFYRLTGNGINATGSVVFEK